MGGFASSRHLKRNYRSSVLALGFGAFVVSLSLPHHHLNLAKIAHNRVVGIFSGKPMCLYGFATISLNLVCFLFFRPFPAGDGTVLYSLRHRSVNTFAFSKSSKVYHSTRHKLWGCWKSVIFVRDRRGLPSPLDEDRIRKFRLSNRFGSFSTTPSYQFD